MILETIDWVIVGIFLLISLSIGIFLKNKTSGSLSDFFLGGRKLPWYIAGISMVATTFAADTPLWVAEVIRKNGISGNWLWWNMLIGGMLTTFFFAKLWRRAEVLTELEFIELRYSGPWAKIYRNFKSIYLGIFFNTIIIGWVNAAMIKILMVFLSIDFNTAFVVIIALMLFTAIYSSLSGLLGVAITDSIQFILAMGGCIILAYMMLDHPQIGGISGLKSKLPSWQFDFFPSFNTPASAGSSFAITTLAFISFMGVQWWASWYPGAEPGGGGYIAQRMMSSKNEKHALLSSLFFQVAHYALRPWPWIIVGLCAVVMYPDLANGGEAQKGFVYAMKDFLPTGLRGLLFTAFLGAYMSTISTQLNWGASYLTNDLVKRTFGKNYSDKKLVIVGKIATLAIMLVSIYTSFVTDSISEAARFLINASAGLGLVLILRWYWWRISIWSEISATIAPLYAYPIAKYVVAPLYESTRILENGTEIISNTFLENEGILLLTTLITTISWVIITFITPPTDHDKLKYFYKRVKPLGNWKPFSPNTNRKQLELIHLCLAWLLTITFTYSILFGIGKLIFQEWETATIYLTISTSSIILFSILVRKTKILN